MAHVRKQLFVFEPWKMVKVKTRQMVLLVLSVLLMGQALAFTRADFCSSAATIHQHVADAGHAGHWQTASDMPATVQAESLPDGRHECCNDAETSAKTGKLCKAGQECNLSQLFTVVSLRPPGHQPVAALPVSPGNPFPPSFNPSDIWRPPALS